MPIANLPRTALAAFSADSARDFACDVLRAAGVVSVLPSGGGRDAMATAQTNQVDVIVTDWPENDIALHDFVRSLRAGNRVGRDTPVVLLTAREGRADLDAARNAGVSAVVVKPVSAALLKHRLAAVVTNASRRAI
jgi:two-component system chemotaxis response regulator CheY